jgi:hypothetical protein
VRVLLETPQNEGTLMVSPGGGELIFTQVPVGNEYVTVEVGSLLDGGVRP